MIVMKCVFMKTLFMKSVFLSCCCLKCFITPYLVFWNTFKKRVPCSGIWKRYWKRHFFQCSTNNKIKIHNFINIEAKKCGILQSWVFLVSCNRWINYGKLVILKLLLKLETIVESGDYSYGKWICAPWKNRVPNIQILVFSVQLVIRLPWGYNIKAKF